MTFCKGWGRIGIAEQTPGEKQPSRRGGERGRDVVTSGRAAPFSRHGIPAERNLGGCVRACAPHTPKDGRPRAPAKHLPFQSILCPSAPPSRGTSFSAASFRLNFFGRILPLLHFSVIHSLLSCTLKEGAGNRADRRAPKVVPVKWRKGGVGVQPPPLLTSSLLCILPVSSAAGTVRCVGLLSACAAPRAGREPCVTSMVWSSLRFHSAGFLPALNSIYYSILPPRIQLQNSYKA